MDTAENNVPATPVRLSTEAAVDALLGKPSQPEEPKSGQSKGGEVTWSEETKKPKAQEADVDPIDQAVGSEAEYTEMDPDGDPDETPDGEEHQSEEMQLGEEQSEGAAEDTQPVQVRPDTVLFHDPEGKPVTAQEAHLGYLRQADYTKKTQEIAEQKKQVVTLYEQRQREREVLASNINLALQVIEPQLAELQSTKWDDLAKNDPYEYAQKRAMFEQASIRYNELQKMGQQAIEQAEQERQMKLRAHLQKHMKIAQQLIPELADPTQAPAVRARFKQYMTKAAGYSMEEASNVTDARMLNLINKAMKYDMMMQTRKSVQQKKVNTAPRKGIKPGVPKTVAQRQEAQRAQAEAKFKKTGKLDDAVDFLLMGKK